MNKMDKFSWRSNCMDYTYVAPYSLLLFCCWWW